ncbi:MAG TPA: hypothetical protein VEW46_24190 [Pyrinomonadaceae bacterium]|nr:hypothetical protein [Pyrinomonadaceae bacterium]
MSLSDIYFGVDGEWEILPEWASYFLFLGFFIASQPKTETRSIIGVALPTRAYAAALAATGVVYNRTVMTKSRVEADDHFQALCELPSGTSITYLHGKRNLGGVLLGSTDKFGEKRLVVKTSSAKSDNETHYVRASDALKVQPTTSETQVGKPVRGSTKRQTGKLVAPVSEFARALLGAESIADFTLTSRLECCTIGRLSALRQEAGETVFATPLPSATWTPANNDFQRGTLQDVMRVRKFMGEGKAYRTDAIAAQSENVVTLARDAAPHVTIFDGSAGFTKWRDYWRSSHWLVLLDSTETGFDEATRSLNTEYITNRIGDVSTANVPAPPAGVELVFYRERLR